MKGGTRFRESLCGQRDIRPQLMVDCGKRMDESQIDGHNLMAARPHYVLRSGTMDRLCLWVFM